MNKNEKIKQEVIDTLKKYNASIEFYSDICKEMTMSIGSNVIIDMDYHPFTDKSCNRVVTEKVTKKKQTADLKDCKIAIRALMVEHKLTFSHYERRYDILLTHIGDGVIVEL
jgi:hypothetical protein